MLFCSIKRSNKHARFFGYIYQGEVRHLPDNTPREILVPKHSEGS